MAFLNRAESGRCPACGEAHTACGPPSGAVPFDTHTLEVATVSGPLTKYRYRGTVLKLNATDAAQLGLTDADAVGAPAPDDDAGAADAVETPEVEPSAAETKARTGTSNKARTTSPNKGRGRKPAAAAPPADTPDPAAPPATEQTDSAADGGGDGGPGGGD